MNRPVKTVGLWNYHEALNNGFMLNNANVKIGDDLLLPFIELGRYLKESRFIYLPWKARWSGRKAAMPLFMPLSGKSSPTTIHLLTAESTSR